MAPSMTGVSGDTMDARRGKVSGNFHDKDSEPLRDGGRGRQQSAFRRVNCDATPFVFAPLTISGVTNAHVWQQVKRGNSLPDQCGS